MVLIVFFLLLLGEGTEGVVFVIADKKQWLVSKRMVAWSHFLWERVFEAELTPDVD